MGIKIKYSESPTDRLEGSWFEGGVGGVALYS